jgi:hypothetical protein
MENKYYLWCKKSNRLKTICLKEKETMGINQYVEKAIMEKDRVNLEKTRRAAMEHLENGTPLVPKFEEKIYNFCKRYGTTRGQVIASILSDVVAASRFSKSANRQRTAELAQLRYLQKIRGLKVKPLPSSGLDSIRISFDGELVMGGPRTLTTTKTIDAECGNDLIFCKYTHGNGGAQDNQASDAVRFLEAARAYTEKHDDRFRFVAILDGDYYDKHRAVFASLVSDRVLVETGDSYRRGVRKQKVTTIKTLVR